MSTFRRRYCATLRVTAWLGLAYAMQEILTHPLSTMYLPMK